MEVRLRERPEIKINKQIDIYPLLQLPTPFNLMESQSQSPSHVGISVLSAIYRPIPLMYIGKPGREEHRLLRLKYYCSSVEGGGGLSRQRRRE